MPIVIDGDGTVAGISVGGLPDGIVDAGTLASNAVTSVKILDDAVVEAKIGASAVVTAALNDDAVTNAKVAANAVDEAQLAAGAVVTGKIEDGTITNADINASAAIAGSKISGASLTGFTSSQMPAGSVLQVVHGAYSTVMSTTSGSTWAETGASLAITPSSTSSKILVMFNQHIRVDKANGDQGAGFAIRRDSTTVWSTPTAIAYYSYSGTSSVENDRRLYQPLTYLDSPSTTSEVTYSTRLIEYGSGTTYAQHDSTPTMMTLMEIAG